MTRTRALQVAGVVALLAFVTYGLTHSWDSMDWLGWGALVAGLGFVALVSTAAVKWLRRDARDRT